MPANINDHIEDALQMTPFMRAVNQFGFSFLMGLCSAYFVKKTIKAAAIVTGGFFLVLQLMAFKGLITIHWKKFFPNFSAKKILEIIGYQSTGFLLGFYIGIRKEIYKLI
jgi:uncharacterized membrane protein (Fun14 family)